MQSDVTEQGGSAVGQHNVSTLSPPATGTGEGHFPYFRPMSREHPRS